MPDIKAIGEFTLGNPKTAKGEDSGFLTAILHFAPANASGVVNVCPAASAGCISACLNTAGRGGLFKPGTTTNSIQEARKRRTLAWFANRERYADTLSKEIVKLSAIAQRKGLKLCVRPNGTSDLPGLAATLAMRFPEIQFYDYTKVPQPWKRVLPNYHLTFSRSESNPLETIAAIAHAVNVAVVFDTPKGQPLPATYLGRPVFDGDDTDLRFLDPRDSNGIIIGLHAKGRAKKDCSGFVVKASQI